MGDDPLISVWPSFRKLVCIQAVQKQSFFYRKNYNMIIISVHLGLFALPAFGGGEGDILLESVDCSGGEEELGDCPHLGIGTHDCVHFEDAGVICSNGKVLYMCVNNNNYYYAVGMHVPSLSFLLLKKGVVIRKLHFIFTRNGIS